MASGPCKTTPSALRYVETEAPTPPAVGACVQRPVLGWRADDDDDAEADFCGPPPRRDEELEEMADLRAPPANFRTTRRRRMAAREASEAGARATVAAAEEVDADATPAGDGAESALRFFRRLAGGILKDGTVRL
jgi:hypothetical protein